MSNKKKGFWVSLIVMLMAVFAQPASACTDNPLPPNQCAGPYSMKWIEDNCTPCKKASQVSKQINSAFLYYLDRNAANSELDHFEGIFNAVYSTTKSGTAAYESLSNALYNTFQSFYRNASANYNEKCSVSGYVSYYYGVNLQANCVYDLSQTPTRKALFSAFATPTGACKVPIYNCIASNNGEINRFGNSPTAVCAYQRSVLVGYGCDRQVPGTLNAYTYRPRLRIDYGGGASGFMSPTRLVAGKVSATLSDYFGTYQSNAAPIPGLFLPFAK